jgi:hypothetical protein
MRSIPQSFWHEFRGAFARLPVWLPGTRLRLGDVGVLDAAGWSPVGTLTGLGIEHTAGGPGVAVDHDYRSVNGTEVSTTVGAQADLAAVAPADVGVSVHYRFSRQGAFVVQARSVRVRQITDLAAVGEQVLASYGDGTWQRDWQVVTEVATAGSVLVLVAARSGAEATVELTATPAGLPVVGASAEVRLAGERGLAASFVTREPTALMWSGRYVRDPLVGRTTFVRRGDDDGRPPTATEPVFAEVQAAPRPGADTDRG